MLYSSAGLLALIIHLIINRDIIFKRENVGNVPCFLEYRGFIFNVLGYYITDILWGILYEHELITLTFIDTALYFFAMASTIFMWTRYAVAYLEQNNTFGSLIKLVGWAFFIFQNVVVLINFFYPILFSFDENNVYHALGARYVTLAIQVLMFAIMAVYAFVFTSRSEGAMRNRYFAIAFFSLSMVGFSIGQVMYPLLPLYAIGLMLGCCFLHSFVLESEREEYRGSLEKQLEKAIEEGNYYDLLTGLQGTAYFFKGTYYKRIEMLKEGKVPTFLFFDLSGMKFYNQRNSFAKGDKLLQFLARLLSDEFGEEDCSRLGSDKFLVFTSIDNVEERIKRLFDQWEKSGVEDRPAIRAGIYVDREGEIPIGAACDRAQLARDAIRKSYESDYKFFDESMQVNAQKQQFILSRFNRAIAEDWIQIYYQPIVRSTNGRVCEEEALARWIDPDHGLLSPGEFIPYLEDANLIYRLDLYIVEQVIKKIKRLKEEGLFLVPQSINLSRADFDTCDMVEEIRKIVDDGGVPRNLISIEITESIIGSDFEFIQEQIDRFRALGFKVWLDDFGSGYSSLDMLQSMRVDLIKFDMRFIQNSDSNGKNRVILSEMVKMAQALGIDTVCEGVETKEQLEFLREIGCAKLQGYYFTKPIPLEKVLERYQTGTAIGFENPEESEYFDTIDRVNLYDLGAIANGEKEKLKNYYNTVPMAIIEAKGNKARFARSNQAYRDFMNRTFHFDLSGLSGYSFEDVPDDAGTTFSSTLNRCCEEGGKMIFDEKLPDGTVIRSYIYQIAYNPLRETIAAAVAVLAVMNENDQ